MLRNVHGKLGLQMAYLNDPGLHANMTRKERP